MNDLILKEATITDFGGIDASKPVIIDFTTARKGQGVIKLSGDQGVGKSSTMMALMYVMGAAFNLDKKNFKNLKDEAIDVKLDFEFEGIQYKVEASSTRITLKKFFKEADKFISVNEPQATLKMIFGNLGVSPIFLAELQGKKQIEWLRDTFGGEGSKKLVEEENRLTNSLKGIMMQRRDDKKECNNLKGALEVEALYRNYEASQKKFAEPISATKEKENLESLGEKKAEFDKAKSGLSNLRDKKKEQEKRIADLERELAEARTTLSATEKKIDAGEAYIKTNKGIDAEYEKANQAWLNLSSVISDQNKWNDILKREKKMHALEDNIQQADGQIDELRLQLRQLTEKYLPKVKGLEIRHKIGLDDEDEGIFYENKSMAQLSESEKWDLFIDHIWPAKGVFFIFCENVNALGSKAIETMNRLLKEKKAKIFASEMDRSSNELTIEFQSKIE